MKRIPWATGAAMVAAAVATPLLIAAPAQAANCPSGSVPKLNSVTPSTAPAWSTMTLAGNANAACGKIGMQRQIGSNPWTTITGVNPISPSSSGTFSLPVQLGIVGTQKVRVFYVNSGLASNYKTITVTSQPNPPKDLCADDARPPAFYSIPSEVAAGQKFKIEAISPQVCGQVTLQRYSGGNWNSIGTDTPGPLNEVFYKVKQKVPAGKTSQARKYRLYYIDQGDYVFSMVWKVKAYVED